MTYHTITAPCTAKIEIKKSEFFGFGFPINSREQIMFHVEQLRQKYPDARHVCYGYIIGDPHNTTSAGFDDDGEPNGTAGKPILNVLQHKAIGNCVVIVVRYFGGIKLGAGGLTRAYSNTAQAVVDNMQLSEFIPKKQIHVQTDFANEAQIRYLISQHNGVIIDSAYATSEGAGVLIRCELAEAEVNHFVSSLGVYGVVVDNEA